MSALEGKADINQRSADVRNDLPAQPIIGVLIGTALHAGGLSHLALALMQMLPHGCPFVQCLQHSSFV
jgi:hypothetical protein